MRTTCRVLVVEDELIARQALRYIIGLQEDRFEIVGESSNGQEALQMIESLKPDVVITDIVMPIMDGVELTRQIVLKHPDIYTIVISGHDEFDYVKSTFQCGVVDYILKPQLEPEILLSKLNSISQKLNIKVKPKEENNGDMSREYILSKLVTDKNYSIGSKELNKYFPKSQFCLFACHFPTTTESNINKESIILDIITTTVENILSDIDCCWAMHNQHSRLLFMLNFEMGEYGVINRKALDIAQKTAINIPSVFFAMGNEYYDILETYDYAKSLRWLLDMQFYLKDDRIVFEKDINMNGATQILDNREYIDNIRLLSIDTAFEILLKFMYSVKDAKNIRPARLKKMLENIIYNTISTLDEMGFVDDELNIEKMEFFAKIANANDIDELIVVVENILDFIKIKVENYGEAGDELFYKIQEYINQNYEQNITLESIAREFHISYSYLSACFSEYANRGFNEYLNEVRIKRAKELLVSTDNLIADISEVVGYSDQSYFGKVFKKMTGVSPSVYRRRYAKL